MKFESIQSMYVAIRHLYAKAVIYKEDLDVGNDLIIEMAVDLGKYDGEYLFDCYQKNFDKVSIIHMHRSFESWIDSLASQAFTHVNLKSRLKFFPHLCFNDYMLYEEQTRKMPGLHLNFDDLFARDTQDLLDDIAEYLGMKAPEDEWGQHGFDMYGKIVPWERAFTKADNLGDYLSQATLKYLSLCAEQKNFGGKLKNFNAWLHYLNDMIRS